MDGMSGHIELRHQRHEPAPGSYWPDDTYTETVTMAACRHCEEDIWRELQWCSGSMGAGRSVTVWRSDADDRVTCSPLTAMTNAERAEHLIRSWDQWSPAELRNMDAIVEDILAALRGERTPNAFEQRFIDDVLRARAI